MATATLLVTCPDQKGLVARLSDFIYRNGGDIIHADHHTDFESGLFLTRLEWRLKGFGIARDAIPAEFGKLATELRADWELNFSDIRRRLAVWVSREDHCLLELLWRWRSGRLNADIALVVSNHETLEPLAREYGVPFHHFPIAEDSKIAQETSELALLESSDIDLVVLAKYMQVLSPEFIARFPKIINIHHSFLPAFSGARPYKRAYDRGVKLIGATAHYVTSEVDEGPIIEQDVARVSHRDGVEELVRKGHDLERIVLARAVQHHLSDRVLVYRNKTVVFA